MHLGVVALVCDTNFSKSHWFELVQVEILLYNCKNCKNWNETNFVDYIDFFVSLLVQISVATILKKSVTATEHL